MKSAVEMVVAAAWAAAAAAWVAAAAWAAAWALAAAWAARDSGVWRRDIVEESKSDSRKQRCKQRQDGGVDLGSGLIGCRTEWYNGGWDGRIGRYMDNSGKGSCRFVHDNNSFGSSCKGFGSGTEVRVAGILSSGNRMLSAVVNGSGRLTEGFLEARVDCGGKSTVRTLLAVKLVSKATANKCSSFARR
jgi:hypothetical protein